MSESLGRLEKRSGGGDGGMTDLQGARIAFGVLALVGYVVLVGIVVRTRRERKKAGGKNEKEVVDVEGGNAAV